MPVRMHLLLILAVSLSALPVALFGQAGMNQRDTLIEIYHATDGDNWHRNDDWLGPEGTECDWYGVVCAWSDYHEQGIVRILELNLRNNNLTGSLPPLNGFNHAYRLDFSGNQLTHPIPLPQHVPQAGIDLGNNAFTGPLPAEILTNAEMHFNRHVGYNLSNNGITGPLPEVQPGFSITGIVLSNNPIDGPFPTSWSRLEGLQYVDLRDMRLEGPINLGDGHWPELEHLYLDVNRLEGEIPARFAELPQLVGLDLSGNRFTGSLPEELINAPALRRINVSDNQLSGPFPELIWELEGLMNLDLSNNQLEGPLPTNDIRLRTIWGLNVSGNRLTGSIEPLIHALHPRANALIASDNDFDQPLPETMGEELSELRFLRLARNRLHGSILPAITAMRQRGQWLDLSDNDFAGPLPGELTEMDNLATAKLGGGLDLCWNDFELDDSIVRSFLEEHHIGGSPENCLQKNREPMTPAVSGSWFAPERDGEGLSQQLLRNGQLLTYWFTYHNDGRQRWYFGIDDVQDERQELTDLWFTEGHFGSGRDHTARVIPNYPGITFRFDRVGQDRALVLQGGFTPIECESGPIPVSPAPPCPPPPAWTPVRVEMLQLNELAGSLCDNRHAGEWISGAWFNPDRDGEGFTVEINEQGQGVVYWFTYQPGESGEQAWMMGDGTLEDTTLHIDNLVQPVSAELGPSFSPTEVQFVPWGSLVMEFDDDLNGHLWFDSMDEEYGSGDYPIERLARPMLAECE